MRLIKEPLLHFLLIGAVLFVAYGFVNREEEADPQGITVSAGHVEHLASTFAKTWQRSPTQDEIKGLIDQFVKEEILSREALKLGLDQNDAVIRRRLQQKMEFVTEDLLATAEPTDADLSDFLGKHPDAFREDPIFTFQQVFLNPERRGKSIESDAAKLLAEMKAGADAAESGDATLLPSSMEKARHSQVAGSFGREFADALGRSAIGEWTGPVASGFGLHLVHIEDKTVGRLPELAEIRGTVRREWENDRRNAATRRFMDGLLKQYNVTIEWPDAKPETAAR
ncbi:MAG: peptidyl-prolyl cis-trans isomerase [Verrucomicrobiales bacterium]